MEREGQTRQMIGCAYPVLNTMGYGFLESEYENRALIAPKKQGVAVANQHPIAVRFEDNVVGKFQADPFVDNKVIVELKSVRTLLQVHEVQLANYLKATGMDVGLLINFGEQKAEVKRKLRVLPPVDDSD